MFERSLEAFETITILNVNHSSLKCFLHYVTNKNRVRSPVPSKSVVRIDISEQNGQIRNRSVPPRKYFNHEVFPQGNFASLILATLLSGSS
jgi:hypothetical protein